jgi:hypothetical protein
VTLAQRALKGGFALYPASHQAVMMMQHYVRFSIGATLLNKRILVSGLALGAFVATLAFSFWREGLWHSAAESAAVAAPVVSNDTVVQTPQATPPPTVSTPEATAATVPAEAAPVVPNPAPAAETGDPSLGETHYPQAANPGIDGEAIRRDRGVQHGPGSN